MSSFSSCFHHGYLGFLFWLNPRLRKKCPPTLTTLSRTAAFSFLLDLSLLYSRRFLLAWYRAIYQDHLSDRKRRSFYAALLLWGRLATKSGSLRDKNSTTFYNSASTYFLLSHINIVAFCDTWRYKLLYGVRELLSNFCAHPLKAGHIFLLLLNYSVSFPLSSSSFCLLFSPFCASAAASFSQMYVFVCCLRRPIPSQTVATNDLDAPLSFSCGKEEVASRH